MGSIFLDPRAVMAAPRVLARSGLVQPHRPDHVLRIAQAVLRYGPGPGFGPAAGAMFRPDAPGIIDDDGPVTFRQLERRCDAVAGGLAAALSPGGLATASSPRGLAPAPSGGTVGILAANSAGFYQAMVGAARCGMDVVYLNTGFTAAQISRIAARHDVRAIIHDTAYTEWVPPGVLSIPMTGDQAISIEQMAAAPRRPPAGLPRRSRHILLSSGTTGLAKGIARTGGDLRSLVALLSGLPYRTAQTCLVAPPMFHAWGWLNAGLGMLFSSTIVVTRSFDAAGTLRLTERERCDLLVAVPTMLRRIMNLPPRVRAGHDTSSLRTVMVSGSPLPPALAAAFMDEFGDRLYSLYGSTEAGYAAVASPADLRAAPGTAGRPLATVDVRVLDDRGSPCPPGTAGMIWVNGSSSVSHPPDDGAVRTGDIGWFDQDGRLFIGGRADDMIITGGENVYPVEIENILEQHPSVLEVAVTGVPDDVYGQAVVAHLVLRDGGAITPGALRAWCASRLAPFQVPKRFVVRDELPRNPAGKVLKRTLREPA